MIGLVWALGLGLIGATAAVITFALLGRKDAAALRALQDLLLAEKEQHDKARGELALETAAHAVTTDELRKERNLRASAESQRNAAFMEEREHVVEIVKQGGAADSAAVVAQLLAAPLANGLPPLSAARATTPDPDALIDPGL